MAALRRVAGMMRTPPPPCSVYPTLMEEIAVRRVGWLQTSSFRRLSHSDAAGDQPAKSPDEKFDALLGKILSTGASPLPTDVVENIFFSAMAVRRECFRKELTRSWMISAALVTGGYIGYFATKSW